MSRPLSPGIAFGCIELLGVATRNALTPAGVLSLSLASVPPRDVLGATLALRWIEITTEGTLVPTVRGERALALDNDYMRLRMLVVDHVEAENPPWLHLAPSGRRETLLHAPAGIRQILVEAGLAYSEDAGVVTFWDTLAAKARGARDASLSEIGRRGERLTINHEHERTGSAPKWIALESSTDGYDVLSRLSSENPRRLTIEVKSSERPLSHALLHITRNEWDTAEESLHHAFHLWDLSGTEPRLAVLSVQQVLSHVPSDSGEGSWESTAIPFRAFAELFVTRTPDATDCPVGGCH